MLLALVILMVGCQNSTEKKYVAPRGELAFLLQYHNRLPTDVGFLSNHIMERRMANLMKEHYQPFIYSLGKEFPLVIDTGRQLIYAYYGGKLIHQEIIVDVANDAIWIDYPTGDTTLYFADRTSLPKPAIGN